MIVKVTPERQITLPANVLDALGVGPGDELELLEGSVGYFIRPKYANAPANGPLRPKKIDYSKLGTLADKIPRGIPPFDIRKFRDDRESGLGPATRY